MKTNNYDRLVCTQAKELFKLCFFYTEENFDLFCLAELLELSNMCKYVADEADKKIKEINERNKTLPKSKEER